jgi:hypothetical protein
MLKVTNSPAICTASALAVSFVGVGTCSLTAEVAAGPDFLAASGSPQTFAVSPPIIIVAAPAPQAISFTGPSSGTVGATVTLSAAGGGSGNPVVFTVDAASGPGVCSLSGPDGATLSYLEADTCIIDANQAGSSQWATAPQVQARVAVAAVASSPPTGVGASISAATTSVTVTWTAPGDDGGSPVDGYQVFRSTTPGQQGTLLATVTATTYTDTTAVPGITYFYAVVTVTAGGFSAPSQEVSATIPLAGATGSRFAATPDGGGWWIVHPDGGIFSYGTAAFYGSLPGVGVKVDDIVGIDGTPDGRDYWLVASDGGVFSFGDAAFYGSTGAIHLNKPMVGIASTPDGTGYWLVDSDGGVVAFGSARFYGSLGDIPQTSPVVGMAPLTGGGYQLIHSDGSATRFAS